MGRRWRRPSWRMLVVVPAVAAAAVLVASVVVALAGAVRAGTIVAPIIGYSTPDTTLLVPGQIRAFDYDPLTNTVYYLATSDDVPVGADEGEQAINAYDLATGQVDTVADDFPFNRLPWLGVGKEGELYVLDTREMWSPDSDPERYLQVYRDGQPAEQYALSRLPAAHEGACEPYVATDGSVTYVGLELDEEGNAFPRFAILSDQDGAGDGSSVATSNDAAPASDDADSASDDADPAPGDGDPAPGDADPTAGDADPAPDDDRLRAYDLAHCDPAAFRGHLDALIDHNLQHLDRETFRHSAASQRDLWANATEGFGYRHKTRLSPAGIFGNQPCERVFDFLRYRGKNYRMGSCFQSIHAFPSSGHVVDADGRLIYLGATHGRDTLGIYALEE